MPRMAPAQRAYALAKAAFETVRDEYLRRVKAELPPLSRDASQADIESHYEAAGKIDTELGYGELMTLLIEAETNLIEWARETVQALPQYAAHAAALAPLWEKWRLFPKIKEQLITLSMRLDPTPFQRQAARAAR